MSFKYLLSYTAVSLQARESELIATLYNDVKDWDKVLHSVVEDNLLQKGTLATRKREFIEFKKRLKSLTPKQISFYDEATSSDVKNLTILSCFKIYGFIYDFSVEVLRDKLLQFDYQVLDSDYQSFYETKALSYENLNSISEGTQYKLKQVMFKMFEQAEFIDSAKTRNIQKPYLSESLIELIIEDNPKYLRAFLYSDSDIDAYIKRYI